jgi:hypothetical protein
MVLTIYGGAIQSLFIRIAECKVGHAVVIVWLHGLFAVVTEHHLRHHSQFTRLLMSSLRISLCASESG